MLYIKKKQYVGYVCREKHQSNRFVTKLSYVTTYFLIFKHFYTVRVSILIRSKLGRDSWKPLLLLFATDKYKTSTASHGNRVNATRKVISDR